MLELAFIVLFGVVALVILVDVIEGIVAAVRDRLAPREALAYPSYSAGFNLRRPDSVLRQHYNDKIRPHGRTSEIYNYKDDPYDVV